MIWDDIKPWTGAVVLNGEKFPCVSEALKYAQERCLSISSITLCKETEDVEKREKSRVAESLNSVVYAVTVKQYMTKKASPDFDFMAMWNNDEPMPLRSMVGTVEKETPGLVYMNLWGDITEEMTLHCMRCGKAITNPVSQFFGMGPECGGHNYVNPFECEEELKVVVDNYRRNYLQRIKWSGWIIKSAIISQKEVKNEL